MRLHQFTGLPDDQYLGVPFHMGEDEYGDGTVADRRVVPFDKRKAEAEQRKRDMQGRGGGPMIPYSGAAVIESGVDYAMSIITQNNPGWMATYYGAKQFGKWVKGAWNSLSKNQQEGLLTGAQDAKQSLLKYFNEEKHDTQTKTAAKHVNKMQRIRQQMSVRRRNPKHHYRNLGGSSMAHRPTRRASDAKKWAARRAFDKSLIHDSRARHVYQ